MDEEGDGRKERGRREEGDQRGWGERRMMDGDEEVDEERGGNRGSRCEKGRGREKRGIKGDGGMRRKMEGDGRREEEGERREILEDGDEEDEGV